MRVPPVTEFRVQSDILPADIKASHKGRLTIDHHYLAVVPVIHPKLQPSQKGRKELSHLDAFPADALPVFFLHAAAAHAVIEKPDLHAFLYLLRQELFNGLPQFVIPDNVILDMDKFLRLPDLFTERGKFFFSIRVNLDLVIRGCTQRPRPPDSAAPHLKISAVWDRKARIHHG